MNSIFNTFDFEGQKQGRLYHLLNSLIVPRPIAFVTTVGTGGVVNAAPFSWFNAVCASPPMLSISIARRGQELKDTSRNIQATGVFVVNICPRSLAPEVSMAAGDWSPDVSEVALAKLNTLPGHKIPVPRLLEAVAHLECNLDRIITLGEGSVDLVLGKILFAHVRRDLMDENGRIQVRKLDPLARLSGDDFCGISEPFSIPRGSDGRGAPPT